MLRTPLAWASVMRTHRRWPYLRSKPGQACLRECHPMKNPTKCFELAILLNGCQTWRKKFLHLLPRGAIPTKRLTPASIQIHPTKIGMTIALSKSAQIRLPTRNPHPDGVSEGEGLLMITFILCTRKLSCLSQNPIIWGIPSLQTGYHFTKEPTRTPKTTPCP